MSIFSFLLPSLAACLLLSVVHVYLGIHVLARGVIFVDLALAQIAVLGATLGFVLSDAHSGWIPTLTSVAFTLLGAWFFASTRFVEKRRIPQEAIIGVLYAVSSAATILVIDRASHGSEHLKDTLVGNLLWVTWSDLASTFFLYLAVALVHFIYRTRFLEVTFDPATAIAKGQNLKALDFLFYATFGIVITSSVKIAGILVVFSFLVVPAMVATLFYHSLRARLLWGWAIGFAVSCLGIFGGYVLDLPIGATIVVFFGIVLGLALLLNARHT